MRRHNHLFEKIVSKENLYAAYKAARKGKSWMKAVKEFEKDVDGNLEKLREMLLTKRFTTSPYIKKYVYSPKKREIYVLPFFPDRIVQHALMRVLEPIWDSYLTDTTVSCRKGRGIQKAYSLATKYVRKYTYCLKCDIKKFYPSIDHSILIKEIRRKIKCKDTLWLLEDIILSFKRQYGFDTNCPIGNYTSQWFGNLYLSFLDRYAEDYHNVKYIRYCDDFLFFSNKKEVLKEVRVKLPELLYGEGRLSLSKCTLFPLYLSLDFVGYRFFKKKYILLRKRVAKAVKKRLNEIYTYLKKGYEATVNTVSQVASTHGLLLRCSSFNFKRVTNFFYLLKQLNIKTKKRCSCYVCGY